MAVDELLMVNRSPLGATAKLNMELSFSGEGGARNLQKMLDKIDVLKEQLYRSSVIVEDVAQRRKIYHLIECCQAARKVVARCWREMPKPVY